MIDHFRYGPKKAYTKEAYTNDDDYFEDVAKAYRTELKILYEAGVRNVQCDDPNLACKYIVYGIDPHVPCDCDLGSVLPRLLL